jgi:hypothetical protein
MAGVAICAIPNVITYTLMLLAGLCLGVTIRTHKDGEVRLVGMTVAAQLRRVVRDREPRMVEGRSEPR